MGGNREAVFVIVPFAICFFSLSWASVVPLQDTPVNCRVSDNYIEGDLNEHNLLWPGGVVKYQLDDSTLNERDRVVIQQAIKDIESKTCIVFQPRSDHESSYTVIGADNQICTDATLCRQQNASYTKFGNQCRDKEAMIHALGHTLCLGHETWKNLPRSSLDTTESDPYEKQYLYDFWSQMTFPAPAEKMFQWPSQFVPMRSGQKHNAGLSVLDADKINSLYNCQFCHSHRWKFVSELTEEDERYMIRFGKTTNGKPQYACRGYVNGEMAVGKYRADERKCYLGWGRTEFVHGDWAQVYLDPAWVKGDIPSKGIYNPDEDLGDEHFYNVVNGRIILGGDSDSNTALSREKIEKIKTSLIPAAMKHEPQSSDIIYLAVVRVKHNSWNETVIGKIWGNQLFNKNREHVEGHFPIDGMEYRTTTFKVFRCNEATIRISQKR